MLDKTQEFKQQTHWSISGLFLFVQR